MREQLAALYDLQCVDVAIADATAKLAAANGAKDLKAKLSAGKSQLEVIEKTLSGLEADLKDSELQLKSVDEKRQGYEKKLGSTSNAKEAGAIEKELKMLKEQQARLDGRTLSLMDQVEAARTKAKSLRDIVGKFERKVRMAIEQESADKVRLEAELAELSARREAALAKVTDNTLISRYNAIRRRAGGTGIARLIDGRCEACRIAVMPFQARNLYNPKEMICCESCGRILYLERS